MLLALVLTLFGLAAFAAGYFTKPAPKHPTDGISIVELIGTTIANQMMRSAFEEYRKAGNIVTPKVKNTLKAWAQAVLAKGAATFPEFTLEYQEFAEAVMPEVLDHTPDTNQTPARSGGG